jgi:hypothetical protein
MESGFVSAASDDVVAVEVAVAVEVVLVVAADDDDDATDARPSSIRDETIRNATANVDRKGMKDQEWYDLSLLTL